MGSIDFKKDFLLELPGSIDFKRSCMDFDRICRDFEQNCEDWIWCAHQYTRPQNIDSHAAAIPANPPI